MQLGEAEEFWAIVIHVEWSLALKHLKYISEKQCAVAVTCSSVWPVEFHGVPYPWKRR